MKFFDKHIPPPFSHPATLSMMPVDGEGKSLSVQMSEITIYNDSEYLHIATNRHPVPCHPNPYAQKKSER